MTRKGIEWICRELTRIGFAWFGFEWLGNGGGRRMDLRPMEEKIIKFIVNYYYNTSFYPCYEEIAGEMKCAKSTVYEYMHGLEMNGLIIRKAKKSSQYRVDFKVFNNLQKGTY